MNVDALKAIARDFNVALSCTLEVRSAIVGNAQPSASLGELGAVALSFKAWPLLHAFRGGSVSQVPAIVAHTFKIHVGLLAAVNVLLEGLSSARGSEMTVSAELLGTFIERRGVLVGARESCAAPPKLLARLLETSAMEAATLPTMSTGPNRAFPTTSSASPKCLEPLKRLSRCSI